MQAKPLKLIKMKIPVPKDAIHMYLTLHMMPIPDIVS